MTHLLFWKAYGSGFCNLSSNFSFVISGPLSFSLSLLIWLVARSVQNTLLAAARSAFYLISGGFWMKLLLAMRELCALFALLISFGVVGFACAITISCFSTPFILVIS